jgi:hypothetical protein
MFHAILASKSGTSDTVTVVRDLEPNATAVVSFPALVLRSYGVYDLSFVSSDMHYGYFVGDELAKYTFRYDLASVSKWVSRPHAAPFTYDPRIQTLTVIDQGRAEELRLAITDILGRDVLANVRLHQAGSYDLRNLPSGVFFVRIGEMPDVFRILR